MEGTEVDNGEDAINLDDEGISRMYKLKSQNRSCCNGC